MENFEWRWKTSDGLQIYSQGWTPKGKPKAVVCLVHGHGEHTGRYQHVGVALAEKGYALLGFDLRGHGKSAGPRGHTPSLEALLEDIECFLEEAQQRYPGKPNFLYGHSVGGTLALNYVLRGKSGFKGLIVTSPWFKLAFEPPAAKVALGRMMNNIWPAFSQASGLETAALSRDKAVVNDYVTDPLVHDRISARMFVSIYSAGLWALDHAVGFPLQMILLHGTADRILSSEASRQFATAAGKKVTLSLWDGWYHELHNEPEKAKVFKVMADWLAKHLK